MAGSLDHQEADAAVAAWAAVEPGFQAWLSTGLSPAKALIRRGTQLVQENRLPEAIARFRTAIILAPEEPEAWTNYGVALDRSHALPEAVLALEKSLALSPRQPDTWLLLGLARAKQGAGEAAEAAYRVALEQEPESALVWQCLGLLKEAQKQYPEAIDCFIACLRRGRATAALCANLGKLLHQTGRLAEAVEAYRQAVELDPANAYFREMLRKVRFLHAIFECPSIETALASYQESRSSAGMAADEDLEGLFYAAFGYLSGFGHREAAIRLGKKHLEMWPASPSMDYLLKAVSGESQLDRASAIYVTEHFDAFAEGFEAQLVGTLGYDIPEKLCAAVRRADNSGIRRDTVDVGCGTGLCGPHLRPIARTLTGVDLSSKMLAQAAKHGLYDELVCEELETFLAHSPGRFDLMVAADVLIYFGDLSSFFAGAAAAIRSGGLLAVSTELLAAGTYQVLPSGRFAHTAAYVRSLAMADWIEIGHAETTIRLEGIARVPGQIFVFRRR